MLKLSSKMKGFLYFVSYLFSCCLILKDNMVVNGEFLESFATDFNFSFSFWGMAFLVSIPVLIALILILNFIVNLKFDKSRDVWGEKTVFFVTLIGVFLTSLLFLLVYYPGSNMNDTLYILHNPVYYSFQYPLVYSVVVFGIYNLFLFLTNSMNISFFIVGFVQVIFLSLIISYVILWFHKEFKRNYFTLLLIIYFVFSPIINNYNSALLRDPIFAAFLLLMIPCLYEVVKSKGKYLTKDKNVIKLVILFGCLNYSRNNGLFVIILLLIILMFMCKKYIKNIMMIAFGFLLLVIIPKLLVSEYEIEQLFQEKVAIPMQQIVYTMKYEGLSYDDEKFMNDLVHEDEIVDYYCPFSMDCIKWGGYFKNFDFNDMKEQFFGIWFKNLPTHFGSYVKAFLLHTYHLWAIDSFEDNQSRFLGLDVRDEQIYFYFNNLSDEDLFGKNIQNGLEKYYESTVTFFNPGTCFWILIFVCLIFSIKNNNKYILLCLSCLFSWATLMIACPLAEAFRYSVYFAYLLPILFLISLMVPFKKNNNNIS